MYLRLEKKISPKRVGAALHPESSPDDLGYDIENVYEWLYIKVPPFEYSLDVTRDHGMSDVDDRDLDRMSDGEIENLETSGPTYIFGVDNINDTLVDSIPLETIQMISNVLRCNISVLPGRINMEKKDPEPQYIISPDA